MAISPTNSIELVTNVYLLTRTSQHLQWNISYRILLLRTDSKSKCIYLKNIIILSHFTGHYQVNLENWVGRDVSNCIVCIVVPCNCEKMLNIHSPSSNIIHLVAGLSILHLFVIFIQVLSSKHSWTLLRKPSVAVHFNHDAKPRSLF